MQGEFLFGRLSTPAGRLARTRVERIGFYHNGALEPPLPRAGEPVRVAVQAGVNVHVVKAHLHYTIDGSIPRLDGSSAATVSIAMERSALEWDTLMWGYLERWSALIPACPDGTLVKYCISGETAAGKTIFCPDFNEGADVVPDDVDRHLLRRLQLLPSPQVYEYCLSTRSVPAWLQDAVIYQIMPDRFSPAPGREFLQPENKWGFYGGTISGVISRLSYLSDLGVNCLWLTPISPSPSHHGYDATDHKGIEPRYGTIEQWDELCCRSHELGMRMVVDFVANHVSSEHPAFCQAQQDRTSDKASWFHFTSWPAEYESFFGLKCMPIVRPDEPGVRKYMSDSAGWWLEHGCDGFRLDHAHGLSHAFWSEFQAALHKMSPDCVLFGEIPEPDGTIRTYAGRMDGCLDFRLAELLGQFFARGDIGVCRFHQELTQHLCYFENLLVKPSFLDNHDMNRFLWLCGGDARKLRLAALCQFTLPGPPIIYYGTEVGLSQEQGLGRLEEARLPMVWGKEQDASLYEFYCCLVDMCKQAGSKCWQHRRVFLLDDLLGLYGYACGDYAVCLNNSSQDHEVWLPGTQHVSSPEVSGIGARRLVLGTEESVHLDAALGVLKLPAFSGCVLRGSTGES